MKLIACFFCNSCFCFLILQCICTCVVFYFNLSLTHFVLLDSLGGFFLSFYVFWEIMKMKIKLYKFFKNRIVIKNCIQCVHSYRIGVHWVQLKHEHTIHHCIILAYLMIHYKFMLFILCMYAPIVNKTQTFDSASLTACGL